jgi:uncharacterized phage protein (TIGR02218 family)
MTYWDIEEDQQLGSPIELYHFQAHDKHWRYTSADQDVMIMDGEIALSGEDDIFTAVPIARAGIEQTSDISKSDLSLTVPRDNALANAYILNAPEGVTSLTIYRGHLVSDELYSQISGEITGEIIPAEMQTTSFIAVWKGRVISVSFSRDEASINCESVFTSLKRYGLLAKYQYLCRVPLYGPECGVDMNAYGLSGEATNVSGLTLDIAGASGQADGWYVGGFLKYGTYTYRQILGHSGNTIQIDKRIADISGEAVVIYPGCNHALQTCREKFNNLLNYRGFPFIPLNNPFAELGNTLV